MSTFQYSPIDLATDAIRLVRLIKGSDCDPIVCEMFDTFLHQVDGTPYEALSYTWGESQESTEITLCGQRITIRDNLFTALWHLRKSDEDRILWIDAICIDQESHLEKGHQVGQMRLIYENAHNVHIWLGKSTEDIDLLMTLMNQLDRRAIGRHDYRRNSSIAWENEWLELEEVALCNYARLCRAMQYLLNRPWFRRVWIIQEVFSAKVATVGCGWNTLTTRTLVLIPKLLGLDRTIDKHIQAVLEIMPGYLRQNSWHSQRPTLQTLIRKFISCEATDPRDRVYALIGISSDAGSDGKLQPDYDINVTMVDVINRMMSYILFPDDCHNFTGVLPPWDLNTVASMDLLELPNATLNWTLRLVESQTSLAPFIWPGGTFGPVESQTALRLLLRPGVNPNGFSGVYEPPLLMMAKSRNLSPGWMEVARILLKNPMVDVNITTSPSLFWECSPLHQAVRSTNIEMVVLLVQHPDIHMNHRNQDFKTPIWVAAAGDIGVKNTRIVSALLSNPKLDLNYRSCAALKEALRARNFSVADLMLQDSRINISSFDNNAGSWWATELLAIPTESGCDKVLHSALNLIKGFEGYENVLSSGLLLAVSKNNTKLAKLLLERIAEEPGRLSILGSKCASGRKQTALHLAVDGPDVDTSPDMVMELVHLLVSAGVPIDEVDSRGRTALWIASDYGKEYLVECLLKHGADVNSKNGCGQSALWISTSRMNIRLVRLLVEGGADIQERDEERCWAPLFLAAFGRHGEMVKYLLEAGADPASMYRPFGLFSVSKDHLRDIAAHMAEIVVAMGSSTSEPKGTDGNDAMVSGLMEFVTSMELEARP